jgi:hypothetical protein
MAAMQGKYNNMNYINIHRAFQQAVTEAKKSLFWLGAYSDTTFRLMRRANELNRQLGELDKAMERNTSGVGNYISKIYRL